MTRYIDADALRADWLENGENEYVYDTNAFLDSIDQAPTADVVEVVRCRDCKYRYDDLCPMYYVEEILWDDGGWTETDYVTHDLTNDDGFCDKGERRAE